MCEHAQRHRLVRIIDLGRYSFKQSAQSGNLRFKLRDTFRQTAAGGKSTSWSISLGKGDAYFVAMSQPRARFGSFGAHEDQQHPER
jgi:hypothetical protein